MCLEFFFWPQLVMLIPFCQGNNCCYLTDSFSPDQASAALILQVGLQCTHASYFISFFTFCNDLASTKRFLSVLTLCRIISLE